MITEKKLIEFFKQNAEGNEELIFKTKEDFNKINVDYKIFWSGFKIIIQKRENKLDTKEILK